VVDENDQPVVVPDPKSLSIDQRGNMSGDEGEAGAIPLFTVDEMNGLQKTGDGNFSPAPGVQMLRVEEPRILQKRLEASNVQPLQEMARMIESLRAFEACQKVLKAYGGLASKADELGSVG
jgi:flagellar basal body rod protein FlgG